MKNDYEMTLNGESTVIPCEDSCDVPMVQCDFVPIGDLENKERDSIVGKASEKDPAKPELGCAAFVIVTGAATVPFILLSLYLLQECS